MSKKKDSNIENEAASGELNQKSDQVKGDDSINRRTFVGGAAAAAAGVAASSCKSTQGASDVKGSVFSKVFDVKKYGGISNSTGKMMADAYDVVVIGTGYGGSTTAARLAEARQPDSGGPLFSYPFGEGKSGTGKTSIAVLERGLERLPDHYFDKMNVFSGEKQWLQFPESPLELANNMWRPDNPYGMIRFYAGTAGHNSRGLDTLTGNGLGGTSLINANIAIRPDAELFGFKVEPDSKLKGNWTPGTSVWPKEFQALDLGSHSITGNGKKVDYFKRALDTLRVEKLKDILKDLPVPVKKQWNADKNEFRIRKYEMMKYSVKKILDAGVGEVFTDSASFDYTIQGEGGSKKKSNEILRFVDLNMCVNGTKFDQSKGTTRAEIAGNYKINPKTGFKHRACTHCGDCMNGCRHGAKNTMQTNYIPIANMNGAEIFTKMEIRYIVKEYSGAEREWGYRIYVRYHEFNHVDKNFIGSIFKANGITHSFLARNVVVSGGTMGSNELMLRTCPNTAEAKKEMLSDLKSFYSSSSAEKTEKISFNGSIKSFFNDSIRNPIGGQIQAINISKTAGERFSGNGDMLYIGFDSQNVPNVQDHPDISKMSLRPTGRGQDTAPFSVNQTGIPYDMLQDPKKMAKNPHFRPVGPCITAAIEYHYRLKTRGNKYHRYLLEDASIYGGMSKILGILLPIVRAQGGYSGDAKGFKKVTQLVTEAALKLTNGQTLGDEAADAMRRTFFFLGMGHDSSDGVIRLDGKEGRVFAEFAHARENGPYLDMAKKMRAHLDMIGFKQPKDSPRMQGTAKEFVTGQLNSQLAAADPNNRLEGTLTNLITVHPLGGMTMADDTSKGVVNHRGQVFDPTKRDGIHSGLYIADGSIVPMAVGVNPFLTITAISERNADFMIYDRKRNVTSKNNGGKWQGA